MFDFALRISLYISFFFLLHLRILQGDFIGWDALNESYGDMLYGAKALKDGYLPLWNHLERGGYPFLADPQTAIFYPPSWLIYLGIFFFGDGIWVALSRSVLHYVIGAFGFYRLLKDWGFSKFSYQLIPFLWMSSARFAKSKDSAALWSIVWLPWLIWGVDRFVRRPTLAMSLTLSLCMTCAFYAGYPPNLFRILLLFLPYAILLIYQTIKQHNDQKTYLKQLLRYTFIAVITCAVLCLPGILATVAYLPHTVRGELTYQDLFSSRQHIYDLVDIILPRILTPTSYAYLYLGLLPAVLVFYGVYAVFFQNRLETLDQQSQAFQVQNFSEKLQINRGIYVFLIVAFFFFTWLACSQNGLLLPFMMKILPVFKLWRIPEQYMLISVFVMLILVAYGLERFMADLKENAMTTLSKLQTYFKLLIPLSLMYLIGHFYLYEKQLIKSNLTVMNALALLICVFLYLFLVNYIKKHPQKQSVLMGLVLILLIDVWLQNRSVYQLLEKQPTYQRDAELKQLSGPVQRILDLDYFGDRIGARLKINDFQGRFSTMVSGQHQAYLKMAEKYPQLYQIAGIALLAGKFDHQLLKTVGYVPLKKGKIYINPKIAAMAYLSHQISFQPKMGSHKDQKPQVHAEKFYEMLAQNGLDDQSSARVTYIDSSTLTTLDSVERDELQAMVVSSENGQGFSGQVTSLDSKWGHTTITLNSLNKGVLVVLETWMPGFDVRLHVNEMEYPLKDFRVNGLFHGILLNQTLIDQVMKDQVMKDQGMKDQEMKIWVEMKYQPDLQIKSMYLAAFMLILILCLLIFENRKRSKQ